MATHKMGAFNRLCRSVHTNAVFLEQHWAQWWRYFPTALLLANAFDLFCHHLQAQRDLKGIARFGN
jgi:hypothetical protein